MPSNIRKWIPRDPNVICDVCDRKRKWHQVTLAYGTGDLPEVVSCIDGCADQRHPLNSPPPIIFDGQPVPNARPDVNVSSSAEIVNSFMKWGSFSNAGPWGNLNNPNTDQNLNGVWTWGYFRRR